MTYSVFEKPARIRAEIKKNYILVMVSYIFPLHISLLYLYPLLKYSACIQIQKMATS
jgi:hypothetical protein